ncbi:hypothetical protein EYF80_008804 [Liparis tanakae]|uniref:Uncharacterized protein n=1 Tax=Liparis tanakae TaxID=230148 RepID=A0A4Z2IS10_9TELE|nr:hypothetical protein EYF80_008804 [Liparis tanakae]
MRRFSEQQRSEVRVVWSAVRKLSSGVTTTPAAPCDAPRSNTRPAGQHEARGPTRGPRSNTRPAGQHEARGPDAAPRLIVCGPWRLERPAEHLLQSRAPHLLQSRVAHLLQSGSPAAERLTCCRAAHLLQSRAPHAQSEAAGWALKCASTPRRRVSSRGGGLPLSTERLGARSQPSTCRAAMSSSPPGPAERRRYDTRNTRMTLSWSPGSGG